MFLLVLKPLYFNECYSKQSKIIFQNWEMCPFDDTFLKCFFLLQSGKKDFQFLQWTVVVTSLFV